MAVEPKDIPLELNILRLGTGYRGTTIAEYGIDTANTNFGVPFYCICDSNFAEGDDILGTLEETLHTMLEHGATDDDIMEVMGLRQEKDLDPDTLEEDTYTPVDLGWCIDGNLTAFYPLPQKSCDPETIYTPAQLTQVDLALSEDKLGIHEAMTLLEHPFTDEQAYAIAKAYREGVKGEYVHALADPRFSAPQMRELAHIGEGQSWHVFQRCLNPEFTSEKLHQINNLVNSPHSFSWEDLHDLPLERLDADQLGEVNYSLLSGISINDINKYATGQYSADLMGIIGLAYHDGLTSGQIERLMNPAYNASQASNVYRFVTHNTPNVLSSEQLDLLCNPLLPAPVMSAAFYGFYQNALDVGTVARYMDGAFSAPQMRVIFDAIANPLISRDGISAIADPALGAGAMTRLLVNLEGVTSTHDIEAIKNQARNGARMEKSGAVDGRDALRDSASESRDASGKLSVDSIDNSREMSQEKE